MRAGPDDAICIIWAFGKLFFYVHYIFYHSQNVLYLNIAIFYDNDNVCQQQRVTTTSAGPDNATCIIWALGL